MTALDVFVLEAAHASGAYRPRAVTFVRGQGSRLWDAQGREYLDFGTGIGVAALGHAHPALVEAISAQAATLMTCAAGYYHHDARAHLAAELAALAPGDVSRVFFSNSGTEAVETALKLALAVTGRPQIVAAQRGFHGRTLGALGATWNPKYRKSFEPLLIECVHVPFGDAEALTAAVDAHVAAVVLEPVQGEAGVFPAPPGYLAAARAACDARGALLVLDEVQTGLGRTGRWFACEHEGIIPDVLCLAKALGGGVPLGATVFREKFQFARGQHGSTFGGNPLACRAGLAVIETIRGENLLEHARTLGAFFLKKLETLAQAHPRRIREARGLGLMLALELRGRAGPVLDELFARGVLALWGGPTGIRFLPPLTASRAEVEEALAALEAVLESMTS